MSAKLFFRKNLHVILVTLFVALIGVLNYKKGTYLSGWDNLQTELYPLLAVKRAFFSVWQEYQSFGLIAGMAHAADLPRALCGLLLSMILPIQVVRYVSQIVFIWIGALGALFLFLHSLEHVYYKKLFALFASLLYVVNIGSVQILSLPFEAFSLFFATLPWLILSIFMILDVKRSITKKHILSFMFVQFVSSSFAIAQQLFVVYGLLIAIIFVCHFLRNPTKQSIQRITLLGCLILICNLYWILPQIQFLRTNGAVVQTSKINQLSTEDIYYRNLEKGVPDQFFFLKNFFLDTLDKRNVPMLLPWLQWYEFVWTKIALYIITSIALLGIFSRKRHSVELKILYALFAVVLLSNTPGFSYLNGLIRSNSFINQIFRSPFTKFIVPYSLVFSFLFAEGLVLLYSLLKYVLRKYTHIAIGALVFICIGIVSYPAFDGYFYPKELQVSIPSSYMKAMAYFKTIDKNKRIALLPDYTYWGWYFNEWGYNGSGFLWYGIEQPIISRTFDVWSKESENYYWEIKQAIESENATLFQNVANKYNVSYFLLDTSLLPITSSAKGMQYDRLNHLLEKMPNVRKVQQWESLVLFENQTQSTVKNFIEAVSDLPVIGPTVTQTNLDTIYQNFQKYTTYASPTDNVAIYPFLNLMSQTRQNGADWSIKETDREFLVEYNQSVDPNIYNIVLPSSRFTQVLYTEHGVASTSGYIYSNQDSQNHLTVHIPKLLIKTFNVNSAEVDNCGSKNGEMEVGRNMGLRVLTNNQSNACFGYNDATLDQNYGYLTVVGNERMQGRALLFYILDLTKKESVVEERLRNQTEYFVIPPRYQYGLGYNFSFQQNSYTNLPSENKITKLSVYAFPFTEIKNIQFVRKDAPDQIYTGPVETQSEKLNYYTYTVNFDSKTNSAPYISLYQSFHTGWKAYRIHGNGWLQINFPFFFGTEIKEHVLVNNWANGWKIPRDYDSSKEQIIIIFWPQYLEYIGFGMLILTFVTIILWKKHSNKVHLPQD